MITSHTFLYCGYHARFYIKRLFIMVKKFSFQVLVVSLVASCGLISCNRATLEDRAEEQAKDFTERYCPTPVQGFQRTDSVTFDRATLTFNYYYLLTGDADNNQIISKMRPKFHTALVDDLKGNTANKAFKDAGYSFHYVYRSEKTKETLYEETLSKKDYQ